VSTLQELGDASYALVTTFRKDGRAVPTPVWIVPFDGAVAFWTVASAGKVKRIRRDQRVTMATCDIRGRNAGPAVNGTAEILDNAASDRVRAAISAKYGIMGWLNVVGSRLRRGRHGSLGIKVILSPS
jgi:PPOX class probable F420-dependent enzyme